jgi:hypothetical protein
MIHCEVENRRMDHYHFWNGFFKTLAVFLINALTFESFCGEAVVGCAFFVGAAGREPLGFPPVVAAWLRGDSEGDFGSTPTVAGSAFSSAGAGGVPTISDVPPGSTGVGAGGSDNCPAVWADSPACSSAAFAAASRSIEEGA